MSDYIAFFASPRSFEELRKYDWDSAEDVEALFGRMTEEQGLTRTWGGTRDGWILSGLSDWLTKRLKLRALGSKLAADFVLECEYVHWLMDYETQLELKAKMEEFDPRDDEMFGPIISEFFEPLGIEFVETYVDRGFDEFYQMFDDLKEDLGSSKDDYLIVLIPYFPY
ncbi:MAG TPA: hypothetical protein V6C76_08430 [Drouetiella sp.]